MKGAMKMLARKRPYSTYFDNSTSEKILGTEMYLLGKMAGRDELIEQKELADLPHVSYDSTFPYKTLHRLIKCNRLYKNEISRVLEVSYSTLTAMLNGERDWRTDYCYRMLDLLNLDYCYFDWVFPNDKYKKDITMKEFVKDKIEKYFEVAEYLYGE